MNFSKLTYFLALVVFLISCNKEEQEIDPYQTCIEGWVLNEDSNNVTYEKCPQTSSDCNIYLKIGLEVGELWKYGSGILIIRNIENGTVEEIRKELAMESHRQQIKMSFDRSHNYTHEVTLELPTNKCKINGQVNSFIYTYAFDVPCDTFVELPFRICTD